MTKRSELLQQLLGWVEGGSHDLLPGFWQDLEQSTWWSNVAKNKVDVNLKSDTGKADKFAKPKNFPAASNGALFFFLTLFIMAADSQDTLLYICNQAHRQHECIKVGCLGEQEPA